jgi:hypothetical protein
MPAKLTIQDCDKIASERGGKCLEIRYINTREKMGWMCGEGHIWFAIFNSIKHRFTWCPYCAGYFNNSLELCQQIAEERGGKCLSTEYINAREKMVWMCSKNHVFEAIFDTIKRINSWCPFCYGRYDNSLELCQQVAEERGGKCLSTYYENNKVKMLWMCSEKHEWEACFSHIKNNNTWCPTCYGKEKLTLEECQQIAEKRGGKCLSTEYTNTKEKMVWKCENNHQWETCFNNIKHDNTWCPECSKGKSEKLVRKVFEIIFQQDFPNVRPPFLKGLELDGYCEHLGLAFEYNGIQHYKYDLHFHKNDINNFYKQQERDKLKEQLCKEHNITLISIPYTYDYTDCKKLENYIYDEVIKYEYLYQELINVESIIFV